MLCNKRLTEKQQRYADEYIRTGNITQSYMIAYLHLKKESIAELDGILQFLTTMTKQPVISIKEQIGKGYNRFWNNKEFYKVVKGPRGSEKI